MILIERQNVLLEDLLNRILQILANFSGLVLLLTQTSNNLYKLISMKLSFSTIFVWVVTIVCLNESSIDRRQVNSLIKQLTPMAEDSKIIKTHARILRSTGDVQENVLDSHVVNEE